MGDHHHCRNDVNNMDPDEGNSWLCSACMLPIFATPFIGSGDDVLHEQCGNLPAELKGCELHPKRPMLLRDNDLDQQQSCSECKQRCGSKLYYCPDSECGLILDVACALPIKILHRSHHHRLVAVRNSSFATCGVCGATHESKAEGRSYFCVVCGFWIHPECTRLPNVIQHEKHEHPLLLYYDVRESFGVKYGEEFGGVHDIYLWYQFKLQTRLDPPIHGCAICESNNDTRFGMYSCIKCLNYNIHISCAISDSRTFGAVLSVEAMFPGLVHFPMPDEHQSFVGYARGGEESIKSKSVTSHGHRLIWHKNAAGDELAIVCDACCTVINDTSFYSCPRCPNFFLHQHCNHLPNIIKAHPAHEPDHGLELETSRALVRSKCLHCRCPTLRVRYVCYSLSQCKVGFDVSCALMPRIVTHEAHVTSHFLRLSERSPVRGCHCCGRSLGQLGYECVTCPNFALHTWCAMLPKTVTHKFDPHPLCLVTSGVGVAEICEICERFMNNEVWHYGCEECDQWFHIDCIPCLDLVSKIKSIVDSRDGFDLELVSIIKSNIHSGDDYDTDVPSRLLRGLTLHGHGNDYCADIADEYDILLSN